MLTKKKKIMEIAEESEKTRRARKKLEKQFREIDAKITPEALKKKSDEIHRWIARHAEMREVLRNKNISLFDANQNAAEISKKIVEVAKNLQKDLQSLSAIDKLSEFTLTKFMKKEERPDRSQFSQEG